MQTRTKHPSDVNKSNKTHRCKQIKENDDLKLTKNDVSFFEVFFPFLLV